MATAQATKNKITLKGSTEIVSEFFGYAVNSILYQRGIYSPETFERKQKYGLGMLVTTDESLKVRSRSGKKQGERKFTRLQTNVCSQPTNETCGVPCM